MCQKNKLYIHVQRCCDTPLLKKSKSEEHKIQQKEGCPAFTSDIMKECEGISKMEISGMSFSRVLRSGTTESGGMLLGSSKGR